MNSSRVLSLIIVVGLALLVTVPPKLADFTAAEQSLNRHLQQAIEAMLASKGFDIKSSDNLDGVVVDAQRDDCHLQLRKVPAQGYNVDALKRDSKDAQLAFAYRGELSEGHPTLRATIVGNLESVEMASQDRQFVVAGGFSHSQRSLRNSCIALGKNRYDSHGMISDPMKADSLTEVADPIMV